MKKKNRCDDCGRLWTDKQVKDIGGDLAERVEPGSVVPSGECPTCGALTYLVNTKAEAERNRLVQASNTLLAIQAQLINRKGWIELRSCADAIESITRILDQDGFGPVKKRGKTKKR